MTRGNQTGGDAEHRQRIDKWLWHARVVKTRSAAAALVSSGHVRLNGARIDQPSKPVKPGDVVTIALDRRVRVLKVGGIAERRGSVDDARVLYEDLTPAPAETKRAPPASAGREPGSGRPTKQERRVMARFTGRDNQ